MKRAANFFTKAFLVSTSLIVQTSIFIISFILILSVSYVLGHQYLRGNSLMGNDSFSFYSVVYWLNKYFPIVPFWFPLQGGGLSFTGYPWFAAYLVNIISHLTPLNLEQSFRLLGFLSVPLTALGIFIFCWLRLIEVKPVWMRQIIGIIASLFYVAAPVSWVWLMQWGFYAEQISIIFVPWILIFFDVYIERLFNNRHDLIYRLALFGTCVFILLGFMTHFFVLVTSITLFIFLGFTRFIFTKEKKALILKRTTVPIIGFLLVFSGLIYFRYYSYINYSNAVSQGGLGGPAKVADNRTGTADSLLTLPMMLSLENGSSTEKVIKPRDLIKDMRFPFYVWLLIIPTLILGVFRSRKMFIFAVFSIIGLIANTNIDIYILFSNFPLLNRLPLINQLPMTFLGRLFFVPGRIVIPISAAYGAFVLWEIIGLLIIHRMKKFKVLYNFSYSIKTITVLFLTLTTVFLLIIKFYNLPYSQDRINAGYLTVVKHDIWGRMTRPGAILTQDYSNKDKDFLKLNPRYNNIADYQYLKYICAFDGPSKPTTNVYTPGSICSFYSKPESPLFAPLSILKKTQLECSKIKISLHAEERKYCLAFYPIDNIKQLQLENWPAFNLSSSIKDETDGAHKFFADLPNEEYRYDISGFSARTIMSTPLVNDNSQIQTYINNLSLIYNLWNYQSQVMYSVFPLYQTTGVLTELAKWFGLNYVYLSGTPLEPHDYWKEDLNWEQVPKRVNAKSSQEENVNEGWRKFNLPTGLITWDNRPKILIISDNSKYMYDETFRFFTRGALLYEDAIPVNGKSAIDYYSYDELKKYEAVFMRGYNYRFRWNAYRLLDKYVKNGGKLIFDTGWQYYVPDYELANAPEFMPFENLVWKNLSLDSSFKVEDKQILANVDENQIGDLRYENGSWGVSIPGRLRDWGKTLLTYDETPLVVSGKYGKGKVVWIGFNIIPHQLAKQSEGELILFRDLVIHALGDAEKNEQYRFTYNRLSPDKAEIIFNERQISQSNIYFRESYFKDWEAKLIAGNKSKKLDVVRAGSGFMLVDLPAVESSDKLVFEIKASLNQKIANLLSAFVFISLVLFILIPNIYWNIYAKFKKLPFKIPVKNGSISRLLGVAKRKIIHVSKWDNDEDNY